MSTARRAFTLIELLVVIAIIGILAALLFPVINKAIKNAKITRVRATVMQLDSSWQAYYREYGLWPAAYASAADIVEDLGAQAVKIFIGDVSQQGNNPRLIRFMQFPEAIMTDPNIAFRDEWGNYYRFALDCNYDDKIDQGPGQAVPLNRITAVWSKGPDGQDYTADDVISWKKK